MNLQRQLGWLGIGLTGLLLSGCGGQNSAGKLYREPARLLYDELTSRYEHELELLQSIKSSNVDEKTRANLTQELQHEILLKHEEYNQDFANQWLPLGRNKYENYPYTNYREHLDQHIKALEKSSQAVYWKNEGLGRAMQDLLRSLDDLRRYIVLHKEYHLERRLLEKKAMLKLSERGSKKAANS
ncbi:MAG TPA: hypothetical protein VJJ83_01560 [Candidatus Babeliales bacterium]|nr:hypothetical protein [Candidatus Babeliales bacterium]